MAKIKSKDTQFEQTFIKLLSAEIYPRGFRYRKHHSSLIGKPDIVFVKHKIAVFLDSNFWHGHNFKDLRPQLRTRFWREKIERNMARDKLVSGELRRLGWAVIRLTETDVTKTPQKSIDLITKMLKNKR